MNNFLAIVDDNFIDRQVVEQIQNEIVALPFHYAPRVGANPDGIVGVAGNSFTDFPMWVNGSNTLNMQEPIANIAMYLYDNFSKKNNLPLGTATRAKTNITTINTDTRPSFPHVDSMNEHYVFLYYVNDSDGDTILYNQHCDGTTTFTENDLTEYMSITPSAGKAVLFNGKIFHSWKTPQLSNMRCVINMNITFDHGVQ